MQAIRFTGWIELISATSFARAVITNYRQASDRQLNPRMPPDGPFTSRGIDESTRTVNWKKRGCTRAIRSAGTPPRCRFFISDFNLIHRSLIMKYLRFNTLTARERDETANVTINWIKKLADRHGESFKQGLHFLFKFVTLLTKCNTYFLLTWSTH